MGHIYPLAIMVLLLLPTGQSGGPGKSSASSQEPGCRECHSDLLDFEFMHYPAGDACDNCHESTGASHPSADGPGFRLMDRVPALCHDCHEESMGQGAAHPPYRQGDCLACHEAHGSGTASLLKKPDPELCLGCHNKQYLTDTTETPNIRRLVEGGYRAHSAIGFGGCMSCHQAHVSDFRALLPENYPLADYLPALPDSFGLCFLCHDPALMNAKETDWATGFRNGELNLHWLHINGDKGRNCRMCHNIHGSPQAFLIEERVGFGSWEMNMNFIAGEHGGSCLPGCHARLSYRR